MNQPRKRSTQIKLVLLGGIASGALSGCGDQATKDLPSPERVFQNNHHLQGAGYYHAPFRNWYPERYNSVKPIGVSKMYYYGGQWGPSPHESVINLSAPNTEGLRLLHAAAGTVSRGGFGHSYRSHGSRSYFS